MTETRAYRLARAIRAVPGIHAVNRGLDVIEFGFAAFFKGVGRVFAFIEKLIETIMILALVLGLPAYGLYWVGKKIKASGYLDFLSVNRLTTNEAIILGAVIIACAVMWTGAAIIRSRSEKR